MHAKNEMLATLHGLRAIAALMVLVGHAQHEASELGVAAAGWDPWQPVFLPGGVDIFFVISGFIMYRVSAGDFRRSGAPREFLLRRLIRVAPSYWFFTACMLLALVAVPSAVSHTKATPGYVLGSLLFFPLRDDAGEFFPFLRLGWTLNYEFMFYAIFSATMVLDRRAGTVAVVVALGALTALGYTEVAATMGPLAFWASPLCAEFAAGIGLGVLYARGARLGGALRMALVLAAVTIMVAVKHGDFIDNHWPLRPLWMGGPAALLCAAALLGEDLRNRQLRAAALMLGDASYALYLSHPFVINILGAAASALTLNYGTPFVVLASAASVGFSVVFFRSVERPLTRSLVGRLNASHAARNLPTNAERLAS